MVFGSDVDLNGSGPRHTIFTKSSKTRDFGAFLAVFVGYSTQFWGPTWIYMVRDPSLDFHEIMKTS